MQIDSLLRHSLDIHHFAGKGGGGSRVVFDRWPTRSYGQHIRQSNRRETRELIYIYESWHFGLNPSGRVIDQESLYLDTSLHLLECSNQQQQQHILSLLLLLYSIERRR